ncbi:MAG TPA: hypothetical protein VM285_12810 [Polyangia bacterium]|nr:hypothetical protein [Polyangia bacterium]
MKTVFASMGMLLAAALLAGCGGAKGQLANVTPGPMPPGGTWDSVFQSPAYGRMEFTVEGNQVAGLYEGERHYGRLAGQIDGNVLTFVWTQWKADLQGKNQEKTGHGYFRYSIEVEQASTRTREVHRITGSWGYDDSLTDGGPWDAIRLERAKKILKPHGAVEDYGGDDMGTSAGFDVGGDQDTSIEMSEPKSKDKPKQEEPEDVLDSLF